MTVHRVRIAEDRSVFLPDAVFIERPVEAALMPGVARGAAELPDFVNHGVMKLEEERSKIILTGWE